MAVAPPSERTEGQPGVDACRQAYNAVKSKFSEVVDVERQQVREQGGLAVLRDRETRKCPHRQPAKGQIR